MPLSKGRPGHEGVRVVRPGLCCPIEVNMIFHLCRQKREAGDSGDGITCFAHHAVAPVSL